MAMLSNPSPTLRWKVLLFGMPCAFSAPILAAMARPDVELVGVVSPHRAPDNEPFRIVKGLGSRQTISLLGHTPTFAAPRYRVRDIHHPRLLASLAHLQPDLIVVACYPRLIPAAITTLARFAAVNVHPSLLPIHRGPEPLFWTFHAGKDVTGVTIHSLTAEFDAGDIVTQESIAIVPDESLPALEARLAKLGADLVGRLMSGLPDWPAPARQNPDRASHARFPTSDDLIIDSTWSLGRANRFIAGVAHSHGPLTYRGPDGAETLIRGLANEGEGSPISLFDGTLQVRD